MADTECLENIARGVKHWNSWRTKNPNVRPDLSSARLQKLSLENANLAAADLSRADLSGAKLTGANFGSANLQTANLSTAVANDCNFAGACLSEAMLMDAELGSCTFASAQLRSADLSRAVVMYSNLRQASLRSAVLCGADLRIADFADADLYDADIQGARFTWRAQKPDLLRAKNYMFVRCDSGLAEQLGLFPKGESHMGPPPLGQSVALTPSQNANSDHNVRLFNKSLAGYDLSGARLDDVRLSGWNLSSAICRGTSFRKVILNRRSNLTKCDLTGALLVETDLTDAALEGAVFSNARVERTALVRAKLCGVKATNVVFTDVSIEGADIQGADFQFAVDSGTPAQIDAIRRSCCNWRLAKFDVATLRQLGLNPLEHNASVTLGAQNNVYDFTKGDLSGCNLIGANLAGAILRGATLVGAQLEGASLEGADLRMADLRQAQLRRAILSRADMTDAKLQNAAFDGTDLSQVKGLTVEQLADTSLIDVILPAHVSNFTGVTSIEGLTKVSRGFFIVQILLCLFAFFTAKSINDGDLLANRRILSWPSLEMSTTLLLFFQWSPLILLAINLWANILLQELWCEYAKLPAYFPDGRPVYSKVYLSFLSTFASAHLHTSGKKKKLLDFVQVAISILIVWWLVPITMCFLWFRCLSAHDSEGTGTQFTILAISVAVAAFLQDRAVATLRGEERRPLGFYRPNARQIKLAGKLIPAIIALGLISWIGIASCGPQVTGVWSRACVRADLVDSEVSAKGSGWRGDEVALVTGARLAGRDLRQALGARAFLAKANLKHAYLERADFSQADFRWADLSNAQIAGANLSGADLRGCDLRGADLTEADLTGATIDRTTNFRGAILSRVKGINRAQLNVAIH